MTLKDISPVLTLVLGILLGAVFTMLAFGVSVTDDRNFNFSLTTTDAPAGSSTTTTHETVTYVTEGGETTTVQRADLRQVALPYFIAYLGLGRLRRRREVRLQHRRCNSSKDAVYRRRCGLYLQRDEPILQVSLRGE